MPSLNVEAIAEHFSQSIDRVLSDHSERFRHWKRKIDLLNYNLRIEEGRNGTTDSNGNMELLVYQNVTQRNLSIGRIIIWADGYTPAAPFSGAGYLAIVTNLGQNMGTTKDYAPYSQGGSWLPNVASYGGLNALHFRMNENIVLLVKSGPPNTNITCMISGHAEPAGTDYDF